MFIDTAIITVRGGNGGNGCASFRREKYIPKGGPDGGDGGNGGSVFCVVDEELNTLLDFAGRHLWKAGNGRQGSGAKCHGHGGADCIIRLPPGTIIYDDQRGIVLKDLTERDQRVCVARGGKGGRGNVHFKSSTNQAPRYAEPGTEGQQRVLRFELKLIADIGLVGKPNAGKSTLLSRLSAARPKIAAYPFTTKEPQLGIVEVSGFRRFVMADIPGLIEGAHTGAGLGDQFLRHIERTRLIVHMIDIAPLAGDPVEDYHAIRNELAQYSQVLADKPEVVVANKMDLTGAEANLRRLRKELGAGVLAISGVTGQGLDRLKNHLWRQLQELDTPTVAE